MIFCKIIGIKVVFDFLKFIKFIFEVHYKSVSKLCNTNSAPILIMSIFAKKECKGAKPSSLHPSFLGIYVSLGIIKNIEELRNSCYMADNLPIWH